MEDMLFKIVNAGATEEEIMTLEKRFHFQMPHDLRAFYLKHNGVVFSSGVELGSEYCPLSFFYSIGREYQKYILTIDKLLEWQEMDEEIPMSYVPFCADIAGDYYYICVDEAGYGKVYYIFSDHLDDFLENPDDEGLIANSFTEFLEMMHFSK